MDFSKYHILFASRRARKSIVVRAAVGPEAELELAAGEYDAPLRDDLNALLKYGDGELNQIPPALICTMVDAAANRVAISQSLRNGRIMPRQVV